MVIKLLLRLSFLVWYVSITFNQIVELAEAIIAKKAWYIHTLLYKIINKNNKDIKISIAIILLFRGLLSFIYLITNYKKNL